MLRRRRRSVRHPWDRARVCAQTPIGVARRKFRWSPQEKRCATACGHGVDGRHLVARLAPAGRSRVASASSSNVRWVIRPVDLGVDGEVSFGFGVFVAPADVAGDRGLWLVVVIENASHLLGEVRVLAGLPGLGRLPPEPSPPPPASLHTHRRTGQIRLELRPQPFRTRH